MVSSSLQNVTTAILARYTSIAYALWAGIVLATTVTSLLPRESPDHFGASFDRFDKLEHLAAYIALGFASKLPYRDKARSVRAGAAMIALGALLECLQTFVPGRSCDAGDMLANIAGVVIGQWSVRTGEWMRGLK